MKTSFYIIIFSVVVLCACGILESEWIEEKMYTRDVEIPAEVNLGGAIIFTVDSYLPDTCWKFSRLRIYTSGFDVYVTPYKKRSRRDEICFLVITPIAEEGAFIPRLPGEYKFHFWQSDSLSLDHTVVVR